MNRVFRTVNGDAVPDVVNHTLGVLKECPWVEVHIGTDSQNHRRSTVYVTVIAYRYGNRGVHYILHKQKVKKIRDKWTRLWNEADYSIEVAEWLTKKVKVESPTQKPGLATWRLANQKLTRVKVDVPSFHEMGLMSGRLDVCIVILNVLVVNF